MDLIIINIAIHYFISKIIPIKKRNYYWFIKIIFIKDINQL